MKTTELLVSDALAKSVTRGTASKELVDLFCNRISVLRRTREEPTFIDLDSPEAKKSGIRRVSINYRQLSEELGCKICFEGGVLIMSKLRQNEKPSQKSVA